ncbi:hypothetical protein [Planctomycetes bacterium K23_9]|uniref:Uncharacterized protein n=1 Tax=Stieleria marina TaxID=1930275 RepID=A0A517NTT6_9BACT|nr:hypothetical protein K239x_24860 [Planctomycetes bacterium K23_9]
MRWTRSNASDVLKWNINRAYSVMSDVICIGCDPMADLKSYGMEALEIHADHLNSLCTPDTDASVRYDMLADALVWSDETGYSTPNDVIDGLRQLRHYRTHVMLNDSEPEPDGDVWLHCRSLFPKWVGFLPARHNQTPELLTIYRRGDVTSRWCLRQLERESHAEGK